MGLIKLRVTPRSSRNRVEIRDGGIKVWVMSSPTDGQANDAVCGLIAETLGVAKSRVSVIGGQVSRSKTLEVEGLSQEECLARLRPK